MILNKAELISSELIFNSVMGKIAVFVVYVFNTQTIVTLLVNAKQYGWFFPLFATFFSCFRTNDCKKDRPNFPTNQSVFEWLVFLRFSCCRAGASYSCWFWPLRLFQRVSSIAFGFAAHSLSIIDIKLYLKANLLSCDIN